MYSPKPRIITGPLALAVDRELGFNHTSPVKCVGGKARQVKQLSRLMPNKIERLYEPFGGGLSTTYFAIHTGRVKSSNCFVGDLHKPLLNFHQVLQSDYERLTLALLEQRLWHGNGSRELFNESVHIINNDGDPFQRAVAYFIFSHLSMLSLRQYRPGSYAQSIVQHGSGVTRAAVLRLPHFGMLLQGVDIQERSYGDALAEAGLKGSGTFVFLDPPYEGTTQSLYGVDFDFDDFAERCHSVKDRCQIMITINDSDGNRQRFKGYNIIQRKVGYGMSKKKKGELIICNYELDHQDYYLDLLGYQAAA